MSRSIKIDGQLYVYRQLQEGCTAFSPVDTEVSCAKIAESILRHKVKGLKDVIGTQDNFVILSSCSEQKLLRRLSRLSLGDRESREWKIPVCFSDGADWERVERKTGLTKKKYIKAFLACTFKVEMLGFIPGFIYLSGLDKKLQVPRKKIPIHNHRPHALAVGGPYAGIYSIPSPAGWNIIGETPINILQIDRSIPLSISVGDTIHYDRIDQVDYTTLIAQGLTIEQYNA